ncbi:MAG: hypothetical protein KR126chlam1_00823 [Chlamydiae bacterium]|nr:hypothetical protein [Chlamydiota bacterium]
MAKKYPLEQLVFIKKKKLEEAERILREAKDKLDLEEEKLKKVEAERDKVLKHKQDKLEQIRDALDKGTRTDKIEQMRLYLKLVKEKLIAHEKKVSDQVKEVEKAEEAIEAARKVMVLRQQHVEKLKEHKGEWTKEMLKELEKEEAKEAEEMSTARFIRQKKENKRS